MSKMGINLRIPMKKNKLLHQKLGAFFVGLAIGFTSLLIPVSAYAEGSNKWSENTLLKALYFDRSIKQRAYIIGGITITASTLAYLLYKFITRTSWEKNIAALEQIEQNVKEHYWYRVKTEELETKPKMPSIKLFLGSFTKNSKALTVLNEKEKQQLFDTVLNTVNAIHNASISKERLVVICEQEFFVFMKELKNKIVKLQEQEQAENKK